MDSFPRFCILNDNLPTEVIQPDFPIVFDNDVFTGGSVHHVRPETFSHRRIMKREADADQIIILHRKPIKSDKGDGIVREELETTLEPETLVRIEASRYHPGGDTLLYFEGAKSKFRRLEEH